MIFILTTRNCFFIGINFASTCGDDNTSGQAPLEFPVIIDDSCQSPEQRTNRA